MIGNREEAKDLLQDVFVKAFKNIKSYDTERNFSSWIYRIAHNESVNHIRRKGLKRFISWEDVTSTKDKMIGNKAEDGMDDVWLRKEKIKEIDDVMKKLPEKYRHILHLRYYSEKSYEEIGKVLKKPVNTVGTLISRAKKKMAEEMRKVDRKK